MTSQSPSLTNELVQSHDRFKFAMQSDALRSVCGTNGCPRLYYLIVLYMQWRSRKVWGRGGEVVFGDERGRQRKKKAKGKIKSYDISNAG